MAKNTTNKLSLVTILLVCLVPLTLAFIMYFYQWAIPTGRTNEGTLLLPPEQLDVSTLTEIKAADIVNEGVWRLIHVPPAQCSDACMENIYLTRQLHLALGKEARRVMRMLILDKSHAQLINQLDKYPNLTLAAIKDKAVFTKGEGVYVVDPLGNIMMFYRSDQIGKPVLKDLKKLLKNSNIG